MVQVTWHALKCEAVRWRRLRKPAKAIECLLKALEMMRQSPDLSRETGPMLNYLADLYLEEGQLVQAEAAIRHALQTNLNLPGPERSLAGDDFMILAKILSRQAKNREAYEAGRQALATFRQQPGMHDKFIAQIEEMVEELRHKREMEAGENKGEENKGDAARIERGTAQVE